MINNKVDFEKNNSSRFLFEIVQKLLSDNSCHLMSHLSRLVFTFVVKLIIPSHILGSFSSNPKNKVFHLTQLIQYKKAKVVIHLAINMLHSNCLFLIIFVCVF